MEEKQVLVKNLKVNYKVFGQGNPLLVLHGWGSNSSKWQRVAELLEEKNIQVIVPDLPGFGESQTPESAWNLDMYNDWILEFTSKVPQLSREFMLLGHSFGGAIAVKFTVKYNQKIKKLFLAAAACVRNKTLMKKSYYQFSKVVKLFGFLPGYQFIRKAFYKFIIRKSDYLHTSGIMQETYLRVISEDLSWRLPFVKVPTIIIWGDKDDSTPIEQAHFINEKIPHSKLVIIPNAGHSLAVKHPEQLAEKILENV